LSIHVPVSEKYALTLEEASAYFGIGVKKIKEISDAEDCPFVMWVGSRRMIKRKELEKHLSSVYSI